MEAKQVFTSKIEIDVSYFGWGLKGKRGSGVAGKPIVFWYTQTCRMKLYRSCWEHNNSHSDGWDNS